MSKLHLTLNISCSHVTCRLKRSWFPFRRSEPTASNTCWNARSGRSTLLTWKACVWASTTWAPWTFPRTTTDEGPLFLPPPSSCSPPGATVCLRTPHLSFDLTWQCRCSQLLMPFLKHTLKNEKRKKRKKETASRSALVCSLGQSVRVDGRFECPPTLPWQTNLYSLPLLASVVSQDDKKNMLDNFLWLSCFCKNNIVTVFLVSCAMMTLLVWLKVEIEKKEGDKIEGRRMSKNCFKTMLFQRR